MKMNLVIKKSFFVFLLSAMSISMVHAKVCSPKDAEAADAMVDDLNNWKKVAETFKKYGHCDDGSIAEGNSEAIARLLVDQWKTLPELAELIKHNPSLKRFVLKHVDSTLDNDDLQKIKELASSSCFRETLSLCDSLKKAAMRAVE